MIVKGSYVWFWDDKKEIWLRGKVNTVNRHHLLIKRKGKLRLLDYRYPAISAYEPKPTYNLNEENAKKRAKHLREMEELYGENWSKA